MGDTIGDFQFRELDDHYTVALDGLDLAIDAGKGSADDAHLAAGLGEVVFVTKLDSLLARIVTGLGVDETLHGCVTHGDDIVPQETSVAVATGTGDELQGEEGGVEMLQAADDFLLGTNEDEVAEGRFDNPGEFIALDLLMIVQAEIGGETHVEQCVACGEGFLEIGMPDAQGKPTDEAVTRFVFLGIGMERIIIAVEKSLLERCDRGIARSVRPNGTDWLSVLLRFIHRHTCAEIGSAF